MLAKEENELLTRVSPDTPAGAMLRRYWWPVAFSEAVKAKGTPVKVKLLAEEFALFRDGAGQLGLVPLFASRHIARIRASRGQWDSLLLSRLALRHSRQLSGATGRAWQ